MKLHSRGNFLDSDIRCDGPGGDEVNKNTGTNLNIISASTYEKLKDRPQLLPTKIRAYGFNSKLAIPLKGEFQTTIWFKQRSVATTYLVLDGEADNILGFSAAYALGTIKIDSDEDPTIRSITAKKFVHPHESHPELFTGKLGLLKNKLVHLNVDLTIKPYQQPAYKVPFGLHDLTKEKLDFLESNGIISKANGEKPSWIHPCQPVAKFDEKGQIKGVRITSNAKQFNKALIQHKRHMPTKVELTNDLAGAKWFSKLDFKDAFNQMEFDDQSRLFTAMATIWGIYYWNRMNMGIATASEIFQEMIMELLDGIPGIKVALDDVLIYSISIENGQERLKQCLDRISASGMTLNKEKCEFLKREVVFFGVTISEEGIKPKKSKFEDLENCKEPSNTKEVRSFLGTVGYFKNRSPYQSSIDKPLRNLIKDGAIFKWGKEEKDSFNQLKQVIIEEEMAFFDHKKESELYVDAGPNGCSSFLTQLENDAGTIKLVRCYSHAFNDAELRYSHLEKEAFACVWACKTNHLYLYGRPFKLITDAMAVKKIFEEDKARKRVPLGNLISRCKRDIYS